MLVALPLLHVACFLLGKTQNLHPNLVPTNGLCKKVPSKVAFHFLFQPYKVIEIVIYYLSVVTPF